MVLCDTSPTRTKTQPHGRVWPFGWISFTRHEPDLDCATLEAELVRLAESGPHLLADIGFQVDPRRSTGATTVWVSPKNGLVFEQPGPAAVRRAG
ncbi:hypothetical protein [Ruegeria sp. PrR005]|uniref:Uncharacterized protein n=1 Tax=Ruegeria sp. PrR005 TaxID=2706882 RepID=A0A6B2NQM3_9RHOB|nr:hypothetical protein [Ruegeria sp. PrR005]NDW46446.1 hypothetical protein [Ruegeria sp. PrR005]